MPRSKTNYNFTLNAFITKNYFIVHVYSYNVIGNSSNVQRSHSTPKLYLYRKINQSTGFEQKNNITFTQKRVNGKRGAFHLFFFWRGKIKVKFEFGVWTFLEARFLLMKHLHAYVGFEERVKNSNRVPSRWIRWAVLWRTSCFILFVSSVSSEWLVGWWVKL